MARARPSRVWPVVGAVVGVLAGALLGYGVANAAMGPIKPPRRFPPLPPGEEPVPLRPPPPAPEAPPPGPLASRLGAFIDQLSDDELEAVRLSMPARWWGYIQGATTMPDDEATIFALTPIGIDLSLWEREQIKTLQNDLVGAIGILDALELKKILEEGGVL